jgi:hypothetical protein
VWIGHHRGHAVRQRDSGEFRRRAEAAFDMHVRIDEAGREITPLQIDFAISLISRSKRDHVFAMHDHISNVNFAGQDIDQTRIAQRKISGNVSARRLNPIS